MQKNNSKTKTNKQLHDTGARFFTYAKGFWIALLALVATLVLAFSGNLPGTFGNQQAVNKYSYLNPATELVQKENALVNFEPLRQDLRQQYETRDDFLVSLYFEYLPTGANMALNRDEKIWPASLIKIPVAMAAMKKVESGQWKLSNELVILDEDKDAEYGDLYKQPTGTTITIEELLKQSLVNSDNTAHFVLLRNLDGGELEDVFHHLGMEGVIEDLKMSPQGNGSDNRMTAKNYSIFFRSLYNATFLNPEYSQLFMSILEQAPDEYLSQAIPGATPFVHKTGIRLDEKVKADSGIVYLSGRPYLLTVMIQKTSPEPIIADEFETIFKDISQQIYEYVTKSN